MSCLNRVQRLTSSMFFYQCSESSKYMALAMTDWKVCLLVLYCLTQCFVSGFSVLGFALVRVGWAGGSRGAGGARAPCGPRACSGGAPRRGRSTCATPPWGLPPEDSPSRWTLKRRSHVSAGNKLHHHHCLLMWGLFLGTPLNCY